MEQLKSELDGLLRYIQRVKQEVAAIDRPADEDDQFDNMGERLEAVVNATSSATNTIMGVVEKNAELIDELRKNITDSAQTELLDQIVANGNDVFEACSFQDITGQRIHKVARSVTYVEARVNSLVDIMGKDEMGMVQVSEGSDKSEDEQLLNGPQLDGQGLSQDDIDKLFD